MIIVYHGILPFERSRHRGLMNAYGKHVPLVYVDPDAVWRCTRAQQDSYEAMLASVAEAGHPRAFSVALHGPLRGGRFGAIAGANRWLAMRRLVRDLHHVSQEPIVVVSQHPCLLPTPRALGADLTVYEIRDDVAGFALTTRQARQSARGHRRMLLENDVVWAISKELVADASRFRPDTHETGVGVEFADFAAAHENDAPRGIAHIARPRIGLIGNLNDRVDWRLLEDIARSHPEWQVVTVGPIYHASEATEAALKALRNLENFHHIPPVAQEEIPGCVAALDLCLLPYRITPATKRINSLKIYQYLAAGKPVVASKIPAVEELGDVLRCVSPHEFISAIEQELARDDGSSRERRRDRARAFDWSNIAQRQIQILEDALDRKKRTGK